MRVLLIDVDSRMPNLALMKLSAWHRRRGDEVFLNDGCPNPDKVYISCVFSKNAPSALGLAKMFSCPVELGGYGVNGRKLPDEVEHIMPDYDLYGINYSMGFTSRGCIRNCPWCVVPKMEGQIRDHAPIEEFLHPNHNRLILLDNNFQASPRWRENLRYLIDHGIRVNFNQGLDIRLVDEEFAGMLADTRYYDWRFRNRRLHFAFDLPEIERDVIRGIEVLERAGIPRRRLIFYVLVGYNTTFQQDMRRVEVLRLQGVLPWIMVYNNRRDIPILRHFYRWVNWRYWEVCDWWAYDRGDSQECMRRYLGELKHSFKMPTSAFRLFLFYPLEHARDKHRGAHPREQPKLPVPGADVLRYPALLVGLDSRHPGREHKPEDQRLIPGLHSYGGAVYGHLHPQQLGKCLGSFWIANSAKRRLPFEKPPLGLLSREEAVGVGARGRDYRRV